jgi:hypothetical protein
MYYAQNTEGYIINIKDKSLVIDMFSNKPIHLDNAIIIHEKVNTQDIHKETVQSAMVTQESQKETVLDVYYFFTKLNDILYFVHDYERDILFAKLLENNYIPLLDKIKDIISIILKLYALYTIYTDNSIDNKSTKYLLSLIPKHCNIIMKILSKLEYINDLDIDFLFNNYNYLLNNNMLLIQKYLSLKFNNDIAEEISKQFVKLVVKEDYRTLLFIPDHKITYEIIKFAIECNNRASNCINDYIM